MNVVWSYVNGRIIQNENVLQLCVCHTRVLKLVVILVIGDSTVGSRKHPWSSLKNFRFRRCRRSNLDQNVPSITNPVSDLTGD
jgi:hypothetical protein